MSRKITSIVVALFVIMLTACQEVDQTEPNESPDQPKQSNIEKADLDNQTDDSEDASNEDTNSSNDSSTSEDSESSSKEDMDGASDTSESRSPEQNASPVMKESYSSEEEAVNAIEDYREIEQTNIDLGNGIKGFAEGAAGHQYISWNEGNWLIEINFPSDSQYAVDDYKNGESMAKSIVNYLEDHMLSPPDERGIIKISGFSDNPETLIRWQQGKNVYEINQQASDPIEALQIAVDYHNGKQ